MKSPKSPKSKKSPNSKKIGHKTKRPRSKWTLKTPKKNLKIDAMFERMKMNRGLEREKIQNVNRKLCDEEKISLNEDVKINLKMNYENLQTDGGIEKEEMKNEKEDIERSNTGYVEKKCDRKFERKFEECLDMKKDMRKFKKIMKKQKPKYIQTKLCLDLLSNPEKRKSTSITELDPPEPSVGGQ